MPPHFPALGSEEPLKPAGLCAGVSAVQSRSQCGHKRQLISDGESVVARPQESA